MAYPALLSEVRLGPAVLRNRVVSTAHQTGLVHDHLPTDHLVAYHEARARGGVGAVFIEATATRRDGPADRHTDRRLPAGIVGAYERLGEVVRGNGARLFVQLSTVGASSSPTRRCRPRSARRPSRPRASTPSRAH